MAHNTLDAWLDEQKGKWEAVPGLAGETVPLFSDRIFHSGKEPELLAALRGAYREQETSSDCSLTSVTLLLDALVNKASPRSNRNVLDLLPEPCKGNWDNATQKDGSGVTFGELVGYAIAAFNSNKLEVSAGRATDTERFEAALRALSLRPRSALLLYVDQGVFTGDRNVPHVTPVGAYDGSDDNNKRVLILDVDRDLPSLYLSPLGAVMEAMGRTVDAGQGRLSGESGGWVWITDPRSGS